MRSKVINITLPEDLLEEIDQALREAEARPQPERQRHTSGLYVLTGESGKMDG